MLRSAVFETWTGVHRNMSWRSIDFKWRLPGSCIKPNENREVAPCRLTIKPANEQPSRSRYKTRRSRGPYNKNKRNKKVLCSASEIQKRSDQVNNKTQDYGHLQEFDCPLHTHSLPSPTLRRFFRVIYMNFKKLTRSTEILCIGLSTNLSLKLLKIFHCSFIFEIHINPYPTNVENRVNS